MAGCLSAPNEHCPVPGLLHEARQAVERFGVAQLCISHSLVRGVGHPPQTITDRERYTVPNGCISSDFYPASWYTAYTQQLDPQWSRHLMVFPCTDRVTTVVAHYAGKSKWLGKDVLIC